MGTTIEQLYGKYHDAVDNLLYSEGGMVEEKALFNIVKDIYRQGRIDMYQELRKTSSLKSQDNIELFKKEYECRWGE